jgi:hypothetical protein
MALALDEPKDDDIRFENDGITYVLEEELSKKTGKVTLDLDSSGFRPSVNISTEHEVVPPPAACGGGCSC